MPQYRLRLLRAHDRGFRLVELDFPSDEDAISVIRRHVKGPRMELWRDERLVAQFEGATPQAGSRGEGVGIQAAEEAIHRPTQAQP